MIRRRRRSLRELLIIGALSVLLICLLLMVWGIFRKEEVARQTAEETKRQLELLEAREASLHETLEDLRTPRGQEASLRETYGVAKPGEEVIIVVAPPEEEELQELPWWRNFLGWLGL